MSISISSTSSASALGRIESITSAATSSASDTSSASGADSASVSGPAAMLKKLKALQSSDPAKFKEVMSQISTKLSDAASSASDGKDKTMLTDLSKKFATAGQTGGLSTLQPPQGQGGPGSAGGAPPGGGGGHHHGGGHHGGGGAKSASSADASSSSSSNSTDSAADTNGDGTVSAEELAAYKAKETVKALSASSAAAYQKVGGTDSLSKTSTMMSSVDSIVQSALSD